MEVTLATMAKLYEGRDDHLIWIRLLSSSTVPGTPTSTTAFSTFTSSFYDPCYSTGVPSSSSHHRPPSFRDPSTVPQPGRPPLLERLRSARGGDTVHRQIKSSRWSRAA
ncbi:hypothetical protein VPH35_077893 [Triticum aestivum]|uniref:Uncharacterized protein n=1 Tax=Aegilops tauschii TaxID=37682 RepID=N1QYT4_AEGTA